MQNTAIGSGLSEILTQVTNELTENWLHPQ